MQDDLLVLKKYFAFAAGKRQKEEGDLHRPEFCSKTKSPGYLSLFPRQQISPCERVIFLLALMPHVRPDLLDELLPASGNFPRIGGVRGRGHRGFLPTGETALFLLAGNDLHKRFEVQRLFDPGHWFAKERILWLAPPEKDEPRLSGQLVMNPDYVELLTTGRVSLPAFSLQFPAEHLTTRLDWQDLVLSPATREQVAELTTWLRHHRTLMDDWGMGRALKPGYRALFYGPPGTGKTLTAMLVAKAMDLPIFRIDLSMVISKYIGETEKNLANLFVKAENKHWILFFDEADALFGKRTSVRDAHDKYANQEVAYLLQRVESYNGLVILASNFKGNIDEAFIRRFQSIIHFPLPGPAERLRLWKQAIPAPLRLAPDVDLQAVARRYEVSGSDIVNIIQYCALRALEWGQPLLEQQELIRGIQRELEKAGRMLH